MSEDIVNRFMERISTSQKEGGDVKAAVVADLRCRADLLKQEPPAFIPGDIVTWRKGLGNRPGIPYGTLMIVIGHFRNNPLYPSDYKAADPRDIGFNEVLDTRVGVLLNNGVTGGPSESMDFVEVLVEGRRLELVTDNVEVQ